MKLRKKAAVILTTAMIAGASTMLVYAGENELPFVSGYDVVDMTFEGDYTILEPLNINGQTVVINGDLYLASDLNLNGGTLIVTGNMTMNTAYCYAGGGNLIVAGTLTQNGGTILADTNDGEHGGGRIEIQSDVIIKSGNINAGQGGEIVFDKTVELTGGAIYPNKGTVEIKGDFYQSAKVEGGEGTMIVDGNWFLTDSYLDVQKGTITAKKDFRIQNVQRLENGYSSLGTTDAILKMYNEEGHLTVEGNFITQSAGNGNYNYLTDGTLELKGNFDQLTGGEDHNVKDNFNCRNGHKVIFSGTRTQVIHFEDPTSSKFNKLVSAPNGNAFIAAGQIYSLEGNVSLKSFNQYGTLYLNSYQLNVSDSFTENGYIYCGTGSMTVGGNMVHEGGRLTIDKADVTVKGDYRLQKLNVDENNEPYYTTSSGCLNMSDAEGHFTVEGNFITQSSGNGNYNYLTDGTLELKGNFAQFASEDGIKDNFYCRNSHKVIFSGEKTQTIYFENPTSSGFNILADTPYGMADITSGSIASLGCNATLKNFTQYSSFSLGEYQLTVTGELEQHGNIYGSTGQMTVIGNLHQLDGYLRIEKADVTVKGNYLLDDGCLNMSDALGHFTIEGNVSTHSTGNGNYNYLTDGTLELKGNFTQQASESGIKDNFYCRNNHKVIFSGSKEQTICFENPTSSGFNILAGTPNPLVNITSGSIVSLGCNATLKNFAQYDSFTLGEYQLTVTGELEQHGNIYGSTGQMTVIGNLHQLDGYLRIEKADVTVKGNYLLDDGCLNMSDALGHFTIEGNVSTHSTGNGNYNYLTDGTLELKGDFAQFASANGITDNFNCWNSHKVIFSGSKEQTIYFENPTSSGFNILAGTPYGKAKITAARINSLGTDAVLAAFTQYDTLYLGTYGLTITGDLTEFGNINCGTGRLTVNGNALHTTGYLRIQGGSVTFNGDYRMQKAATNEDGELVYETAESALVMDNAAGRFTVNGNMIVQSSNNGNYNYLTAGTLVLRGDFTQLVGNSTKDNFNCWNKHITILDGDKAQNISFSSYSSSKFNYLYIRKDRFKAGLYSFNTTTIPGAFYLTYDNLSFVDHDTVTIGNPVTIVGAATAGTDPYTYLFYVRAKGDTDWIGLDAITDEATSVTYTVFTPAIGYDYELKAVAVDADGTPSEKIITIHALHKTGLTGWQKEVLYWLYYNKDGSYVTNSWKQIGSKWYHFDTNGFMQTGWYQENGTYYYLKADGSMAVDEWVENDKYYLDASGKWIKGKKKDVEAGWKESAKGRWYQNEDGSYPKNQWKKIEDKWYHFDANGYVQTGWYVENGNYYYLKEDGSMAVDEWVENDKYYVDANGRWVKGKVKEEEQKTGTWKKDSKGWWYQYADKTYPKNQWAKIDGKWYHFDANGYMQTGWYKEGNYYYFLKSNGQMAANEWVQNGKYYIDSNGHWDKDAVAEA